MTAKTRALFTAILLIVTVQLAACDSSRLKGRLLAHTPIGTSFGDVLSYCSRTGLQCKSSNTAGYLNQDTGQIVGVKSIWAKIDEYKSGPFFITSVTAYWGFDKNGVLIDIWVWKTTDAP